MICNTCGRQTQNEEANFCEYCGSSFRENINIPEPPVLRRQAAGQPVEQTAPQQETSEKPISFMQWLGMYAILFLPLFIPFIGWVIPLVMLFVWAFANKTPITKKNWSRATLIFLLVYFIVAVFVIMSIIGNPIFQKMLAGTFDLDSIRNMY
ncbi:MAG TPA: hypothetical protein DIW41_11940 [Lachnospiraceae bacterium]|nr:hypothetical protein [Lachnospiraceae bacterium]